MRLLNWILCLLCVSVMAVEAGSSPRDPSRRLNSDNRKALVLGKASNAAATHAQLAKNNFLKLVKNPKNKPSKGWTCDLSWDVMQELGMDPATTRMEELFQVIGEKNLGYRIVMQNTASGQKRRFWSAAVENGIMPFAPHGNNTLNLRIADAVGIGPCVSVAGGSKYTLNTHGPSLEFFDALPIWASHSDFEDAAQSWANQNVAAKFAKILDAHPEYNIWDARTHLRQSASHWETGWTEKNGYGRPNAETPVGKLLPAPPVQFRTKISRDGRQVQFTWQNFLMSDFAATVITSKDGKELYRGSGTNFLWTSDVKGQATFLYWSENKAGDRSRMESYQERTVLGLSKGP